MQVSVESTSSLERKMTVEVPAERINDEVESRLRKYAKQVKMDGFRPGKVPMKIVRRQYEPQIRQEVLGEVIEKSYFEALAQEEITPAGMPSIDPAGDSEDGAFSYVATFEVIPEVQLADRGSVKVERVVAEAGDADVETMLERLRSQRREWDAVERPAAAGDQITVSYKGKEGDEYIEDAAVENTSVVLGEGRLFPEFETQLTGITKDEEKSFEVTFPDDYPAENAKGKTITFEVTCHEVAEPRLPEIDDEFAKALGVEEGVDALRAQVLENMNRELAERVSSVNKNAVMDALLEAHEVDAPAALVSEEVERVKEARKAQGMPDMGDDSGAEEEARRRVVLGLIIREIISANDINVDRERVDARIESLASTYEDPAAVVQMYKADRNLMQQAEGAALEEQVVEWVYEGAEVTEVNKSFEELMNPMGAEAA
ncbi:MAG: trigger factor [Gammaproteobacteria bacterium]